VTRFQEEADRHKQDCEQQENLYQRTNSAQRHQFVSAKKSQYRVSRAQIKSPQRVRGEFSQR
jgi:hypothetical protein